MESLSSKNKDTKYLFWFKPLEDKKGKAVLNAFMEIVNKSNRKPSNSWLIKEKNFTINLCKNV